MGNRGPISALRIISALFLLIAIVLTTVQLARFSRVRSYLPAGLKIANLAVGGYDRQTAASMILEVYSLPIELRYNGSPVHLLPSVIDYKVDIPNMLAAADVERTRKSFWLDFWDYLWGRTEFPTEIPLTASYSEIRLRSFLKELAERYDTPATAAMPVAGSVNFIAGQPGTTLDIDNSVMLVSAALASNTSRELELPLKKTDPNPPSFGNLEVLLKQIIETSGFDGLAGIYLMNLENAQEIHFAIQKGQVLPVEPDISFTASSIIKIPIMVSSFRRMTDESDQETMKLMTDMVDKSGNEAADWLMDRVIDPKSAPLIVSEDMKELGLKNTFLAGYFSLGSPLLAEFKTPANQRQDINTDPDPYNQTTPSDIGMLLTDIYQCSQNGGGTLTTIFAGQITQSKCQMMNNLLVNNRLPMLLTAGIPEGTQIAHKHGWVSTNGIINTIGDAAIIYTPGGNYVLVIFLHHQDQLIWDSASLLIAQLSQAVFNYYNFSAP